MRILKYIAVFCTILGFVMCTKEDDSPNPFDVQDPDIVYPDTVDPTTIVGLHKYIFSVKCANPTCHDGSFEPDFRTVESTYQTLVYHPVTKNNNNGDFEYRVLPGKHTESWLHERLVTTDEVIGRMPLYAEPLNAEEIGWVDAWINNGAPNADGMPAVFPNQLPSINGFALFDAQQNRVDTVRMNGNLSPILLPNNQLFTMYVLVEDDSTAVNDMLVNTGKFAYDEYDFSNATSITATPFGGVAHALQFNSNQFTPGDTVWFRYYVRDMDNPTTVEFPNDNSPFYFRILASFVVQ